MSHVVSHESRVLASRLPAPPEPRWFVVGSDVPFEPNWENYSPILGYNPCSFMRDSSNFIHLRGQAALPASAVAPVLFYVPATMAPERLEQQPAAWRDMASGETVTLFIHPDGAVELDIANLGIDIPWVSLDNHQWKASSS